MIIVKRSDSIDVERPYSSQLCCINFGEGSPYDSMHAYLRSAMRPFFASYAKESSKSDRECDKIVPEVEKKMAELEMGLLHLQQNIGIPDITLPIHPTVQTVIRQCEEQNRKAKAADFGEKVEDSAFLNQLQSCVTRWTREIQKITKLDRDASSGTTMQEVRFWLELERALLRVQERRQSLEVTLTLDILRQGRRYMATVQFDADTGLKSAIETAADYNQLMRDFPLPDLLAASGMDQLKQAVIGIFSHMKRLRNTQYPLSRAVKLIDAISRDLTQQMLRILSSRRLILLDYHEFEPVLMSAADVFATWEDEYEKLQGVMRDIAKRKHRDEQAKSAWRKVPNHKKLQQRLEQLRRFRQQHEQLRQVIGRVLSQQQQRALQPSAAVNEAETPHGLQDSSTAADEVRFAYDTVREVDVLDLSREGQEAWEAALRRYEERINQIEARIASQLRDQLAAAKSTNEMFRIFSKFNPLLVRPHIRGAIREYQQQLLDRVRDTVELLQSKLREPFEQTGVYKMMCSMDLCPLTRQVTRAKILEYQLDQLVRMVEDVLGREWQNHVDGQKLKSEFDGLRVRLNTSDLVEDWLMRVKERPLQVTGPIFSVESSRTRQAGRTQLQLRVNFHDDAITLHKEVRNLRSLGFRIPLQVSNKAHQAQHLYPHAISLKQSISVYESTTRQLQEKPMLRPLLATTIRDLHTYLAEGSNLVWEDYKLENYVQRLTALALAYQDRVNDVVTAAVKIEQLSGQLNTCDYNEQAFSEIIEAVQSIIDELSLKQYSNLATWVGEVDKDIEKRLAARLETALNNWNAELNETGQEEKQTPKITIELRMTQQCLYVVPPIEHVREQLMQGLDGCQNVILRLSRLRHARLQVAQQKDVSSADLTYRQIFLSLPSGLTPIEQCSTSIEKLVGDISKYVDSWLRYQALWDLQPATLYARLENHLPNWMATIKGIRDGRSTFDTSETRRLFGPVAVDFAKVQTKVSLKYDSWHKEVVQRFGQLAAGEMHDVYTALSKARSNLEQQPTEPATTSDAVALITAVQQLKRKIRQWEKQVESYRECERLLERQRFQFPSTWTYAEQLGSEWTALNELLGRKDQAIQTQVASLQTKVLAEERVVEEHTVDFLSEWDTEKPVEGAVRPDLAIRTLQKFDQKLQRLLDERSAITKAKEILEIGDVSTGGGLSSAELRQNADRTTSAAEELNDLKTVWSELGKICQALDEMRDKPWATVQPRKLRSHLESLMQQLVSLPARMRHYAGYDHLKRQLQSHIKSSSLMGELKSEAVRERHWKELQRRLNQRWSLTELTLGHLLDADLGRNEQVCRDILLIAQGEMGLEQFLRTVNDYWRSYNVELTTYQQKCPLIRGWDELFTHLREHLNSVTAMKLSPYYKQFEDEAVTWEDRLTRLSVVFDTWVDVQRRFVYLDGVFSGSTDIKHLLPTESQRFGTISSEFVTLMRRVAKAPQVLDILNIPNLQKQLERLCELLTKIQKTLGEYLERERAAFARFYFVGDEDLLEMIGNSKNLGRLQRHLRKMFGGVNQLDLNEDQTAIIGVASREGESIKLQQPVNLVDIRLNEWLAALDNQLKSTLSQQLILALRDLSALRQQTSGITSEAFLKWVDNYPSQIIVLAGQVNWSESVENGLENQNGNLGPILQFLETVLSILAEAVLAEQPPVMRKKLEGLITEMVHKRDVTRNLASINCKSAKSFEWQSQMRFYVDPSKISDAAHLLRIEMASAKFFYGFEYIGVADRLVQTPLTDRAYLALTQALGFKLGGSPFGPAGTGKTETVKALGQQLGRFVLVFNCDESFDFQAMGRIFVGLCQVGAWGCFDEFNRLEERMLSAVSQQIQTIQTALRDSETSTSDRISIDLIGRSVRVNTDMAIFITMNPGYAGRSNLPDNLKQLFRSLAMTVPDKQLIAQVMLFSQGFQDAELLASKVVPFFNLCLEQLSPQSHYDFGLRALKSVLVSAGGIKRDYLRKNDVSVAEQAILIQSIVETVVPKLVADDIPLLNALLVDVFPGSTYQAAKLEELRNHLRQVCQQMHLTFTDNPEASGYMWSEKVIQLYQISLLHHGFMLVGPSGSGKTTAWRVLLKAIENLTQTEYVAHVIEPKALSKEALYGNLDPNTREWSDGLFTALLRRIVDNARGELKKQHWIIFDGDVDPDWVENLNSVLDDNKLLTLPSGERIALPSNVRIVFEVQDLRYATLATVSRCGMVWFSDEVIATPMILEHFLAQLRAISLDEFDQPTASVIPGADLSANDTENPPIPSSPVASPSLTTQQDVAAILAPYFAPNGLVVRCLEEVATYDHIMEFTKLRALTTLFGLLNAGVRSLHRYNQVHQNFALTTQQLELYVPRLLAQSLVWALAGDGRHKYRIQLSDYLRKIYTVPLPEKVPLVDFDLTPTGDWIPWSSKVPQIEVESHRVGAPDIVIPTLDTVRHESLLSAWLADHRPLILCGPPGSGKTMTLLSALRSLPEIDVVGLNFSSATTPELLLKTFDQHCEYKRTPNGIVLTPRHPTKWMVLFADEINLPDPDQYGTMRVIALIRQLVERGGFYRPSDQQWVRIERLQFVGACNPPSDPGRKPLSPRFLRHAPVIYVDYPAEASLIQIYGTFCRAMLRGQLTLRAYAEQLAAAMVELYLIASDHFTPDQQPHYVFSPRELTRWTRGIHEALKPLDSVPLDAMVRLWAHEGLRLFHDRLISPEERRWIDEQIDGVALKNFPNVDREKALSRPLLYSNWLSKYYVPVERQQLAEYVRARLKTFYEEELDVPLVLFDDLLDHVLRIDRILRQPQGHLLLVGVSGAGKTTLTRFVAWLNGLSIFRVKVHAKYTAQNFDDDLRIVLRRAGCKGERIVFIMDESNLLDSSFLERINTLLANAEIPGLFEGDELTTLYTQCKEGAAREGLMLDGQEEMYKWFTDQVARNLHVVFTMNPSAEGLRNRASTSPALFNRCVINWFGEWSPLALFQVGRELTSKLDVDKPDYQAPIKVPIASPLLPPLNYPPSYRDMIANAFVFIHQTVERLNQRIVARGGRPPPVITPRHYLDMIQQFVKLFNEKRSDLEEQQLHVTVGLNKLAETVDQVEELRVSLAQKNVELEQKNKDANLKLQEIVADQQEAEKEKQKAEQLQLQLTKQTVVIEEKQQLVRADLARVEPELVESQSAVRDIKRKDLVEIRSLQNPPALVKMAVESVCTLLGETELDWKALRAVLVRDNFIQQILNFDAEKITDVVRERMKTKFTSNPDYTYEKVNRASAACGPLVRWATALINYSDMLSRVEPLRMELQQIESDFETNRVQVEAENKKIKETEERIQRYKDEYAQLIRQAGTIKQELVIVQTKVERSVSLIKSLEDEQHRWKASADAFRQQMTTLNGDVLLCGAFLAYSGAYDQQQRAALWGVWQRHLGASKIEHRHDLARIEYLSTPEDRLRWRSHGLPADDLCMENAILLKRYCRYPLIIDPSGEALEFIMKDYQDKRIMSTSFLDDAFRKQLESALRFGNPLLVHDVDRYDALLNPVLNRELRRAAGRVLVTLGDQEIDVSPSFLVILATRDPAVELPPDLSSRVTVANFSVTRSGLQAQCLNRVLRAERPDVDAKRSDLLRLQGEYVFRLRQLERSLLQALNESKGRLLDDDTILAQLEQLKAEAADVEHKMGEMDTVLANVEAVSNQYSPLATAAVDVYFLLDSLANLHFLYQFSLHFFLDLFNAILPPQNSKHLDGIADQNQRLDIITNDLFTFAYRRSAVVLVQNDRTAFAVALARIRLRAQGFQNFDEEFEWFLRGSQLPNAGVQPNEILASMPGLTPVQQHALSALMSRIKVFKPEEKPTKEGFTKWLNSISPELDCIKLWQESKGTQQKIEIENAMYSLLVIQALRPDRIVSAARIFAEKIIGREVIAEGDRPPNFAGVVESEIRSSVPVLLVGTGVDPSGRVEQLASDTGRPLTQLAMGAPEVIEIADKTINGAARQGRWVLLKNVHLQLAWLGQLEKRLHTLQPHQDFRLFLTMEANPRLPTSLLRAGRLFVFEPSPGLRSSLERTLANLPVLKMTKPPVERSRLYLLLAWLHATVQERLRYSPLGWTHRYEFNDTDLRVAIDTLDVWIDQAALGRQNLPPQQIPWKAVRTLMSQAVYGGRLDNAFDQKLLDTLLGRLFTSKSFEETFKLAQSITLPESSIMSNRDELLTWARNLGGNVSEHPSWIGLPESAETTLLTTLGNRLSGNLLKLQALDVDTAELLTASGKDEKTDSMSMTPSTPLTPGSDRRPAWLRSVGEFAIAWLERLPTTLPAQFSSAPQKNDPLIRAFERELQTGSKLLVSVRADLDLVAEVAGGKRRATNHARQLMAELARGELPVVWKKYRVPPTVTAVQWLADFAERVNQLEKLASSLKKEKKLIKFRCVWVPFSYPMLS